MDMELFVRRIELRKSAVYIVGAENMRSKRGFPKACKWTVRKWEKCLKDIEKKDTAYNKYAVCNSMCLKKKR
jgi:hypothetical protein